MIELDRLSIQHVSDRDAARLKAFIEGGDLP
jgi:hypothetical protein